MANGLLVVAFLLGQKNVWCLVFNERDHIVMECATRKRRVGRTVYVCVCVLGHIYTDRKSGIETKIEERIKKIATNREKKKFKNVEMLK